MSLGEIVLLLIVGIIVVGPRNLPTLMRTAGQWIGRLRRLTTELRSQSGIDDILRKEGLDEHLHELRSLSRMNMVESLIAPTAAQGAQSTQGAASAYPRPTGKTLERPAPAPVWTPGQPLREREYPLIGCDSYGALPDDVISYRMMAEAAKASEEPVEEPAQTPEPVETASPAPPAETVAQEPSLPGAQRPAAESAEPTDKPAPTTETPST